MKTSRSETKWKSAKTPAMQGAHYVIQHTTDNPKEIRLCVGGAYSNLDIALIDALVADLLDARNAIAPIPQDPDSIGFIYPQGTR